MLKIKKPSEEKATTEKEGANKEEPAAQVESPTDEAADQAAEEKAEEAKEEHPLSKKEQLKEEQGENAKKLGVMINDVEDITKEVIETIEGELKGKKLSKNERQKINKWLRDACATVEKQENESEGETKKETRGKKAKDVTMYQIRNQIKETIVNVQKYADQQIEQKKSVRRVLNAKIRLQRLLKYQLTE